MLQRNTWYPYGMCMQVLHARHGQDLQLSMLPGREASHHPATPSGSCDHCLHQNGHSDRISHCCYQGRYGTNVSQQEQIISASSQVQICKLRFNPAASGAPPKCQRRPSGRFRCLQSLHWQVQNSIDHRSMLPTCFKRISGLLGNPRCVYLPYILAKPS